MSIPDWPSWNQSSAFEGQSGVDTCHHGIRQKSFWLLFEGEKPAAWGGRLAVGGMLFGRLQSSGVGRWLSLQIWLEGQIREKRNRDIFG